MRTLLMLFLCLGFISCDKSSTVNQTVQKKNQNKVLKQKVIPKATPKVVVVPVKKGCINGMCGVPAGDFMMGCNGDIDQRCDSDEKPYHKVYLDGYYIDQHEVTILRKF